MKRLIAISSCFLAFANAPADASPLEPAAVAVNERAFILPKCPRSEHDRVEGRDLGPDEIWKAPSPPVAHGAVNRESVPQLVLALLAKPAFDAALSMTETWLEERAQKREISRTWVANGYAAQFVAAGDELARRQCIVVASGSFTGPGTDVTPTEHGRIREGDWSDHWLRAFGLAAAPDFYAEIEMVFPVRSMAAFSLVPRRIEYRRSGIKADAGKARHLGFAVVFSRAGVAAGATALSIPGAAKPGTIYNREALAGYRSPWIASEIPRHPDGKPKETVLAYVPLSVRVTMTEGVEPSAIDRFVAKTFALAKEPLSARVGQYIEAKTQASDDQEPIKIPRVQCPCD